MGAKTVVIAGQQFELTGYVGAYMDVEYRHDDVASAPSIGKISEVVGKVAAALEVGDAGAFSDRVMGRIAALGRVSGLESVAKGLHDDSVRVTRLGINSLAGLYRFGFAVDLSASRIAFQGVTLDAVGIDVTYKRPAGT